MKLENIILNCCIAFAVILTCYWMYAVSIPLTGKEMHEKIEECKKYDLEYKEFRNMVSGGRGVSDINCVSKATK